MPPAGPVDRYVPRYTESTEVASNATGGLRGGGECGRGRGEWAGPVGTFLATRDSTEVASNATGWPGGSLRSSLHGTAPKSPRMPPAGPVALIAVACIGM